MRAHNYFSRYPASQPLDPVEVLFLEEIIRELSPQAKEVAKYIRMGYTWQDIGETLGVDHSAIRKSFTAKLTQS
jgi:DNA-binding NarL/FixJ family response regulator